MVRLVLRRLLLVVPVLFGLLVLVFVLTRIVPADPAAMLAGEQATPDRIAILRAELGLDQPLWVQFWRYLAQVASGDFGTSLYTHRAVVLDLAEKLPATLELALATMTLAIGLGVPLGVIAAVNHNRWLDQVIRLSTIAGLAIASFWLAIMLQLAFSMWLEWLPLRGRITSGVPPPPITWTGMYTLDYVVAGEFGRALHAASHLVLPSVTLALPATATMDRPGRSVIFLEDLTRIQSQAQQLKLAALGRLTANIAHEIRNPLSAINHATELLQETESVNATDARLLQIIHDNTARIDGMVQEVLKLNRRDRVHREVVELTGYLGIFATEFCNNERIDRSVLSVESDGIFPVQFDRSHLNQVMWNLCRNALRHGSQSAGSIRIVARPGDAASGPGSVFVDVLDDGPGIPPAVQSQLFEPFFTTASSGTGLGLYLARELADANGGTLDFAAGPPPTRFTLQCKAAAEIIRA